MQGEQYSTVAQALREGDLERAPVAPAERALLEFVGTLTRHAYRVTDEQVQGLRDVGWTDAQIAEAVYDGALFSLFVRLADAFDIHPPAAMDPNGPPAAIRWTDGDGRKEGKGHDAHTGANSRRGTSRMGIHG